MWWFRRSCRPRARDLDGNVGGLDGGDRQHSRLQAEVVGRLAAEQGYEPVRPGLDFDLSHHGVADNPGDQAAEPVARGVGHHGLACGAVRRLGQFLGKPGQRHPINGEPPRGIGDRFDPPILGPAPQGVSADPEQAGRFPDPEGRHPGILAQIRLQAPVMATSTSVCIR
jgi:hypothetical protein